MTDGDLKKIGDIVDERINSALKPVKDDLQTLKVDIQTVKGSVLGIERDLKAYGDMYKINNDNAKKLEKRTETLEDAAGITPPPELTLAEVS